MQHKKGSWNYFEPDAEEKKVKSMLNPRFLPSSAKLDARGSAGQQRLKKHIYIYTHMHTHTHTHKSSDALTKRVHRSSHTFELERHAA